MAQRAARLAPELALAAPVLTGLGWMALAGAPAAFLLVNGAALALALACAKWLPLPRSGLTVALLTAGLVGLLAFSALFGLELGGVRRWIGLGPLRLHIGYLVLPLLLALTNRLSSWATALLLAVAAAATAVQPDLAACIAMTAAICTVALQHRDWPSGAAMACALICTAKVLHSPDHLSPVRFVETVQIDALHSQPAIGLLLIAATIAPSLLALRPHARQLAVFIVTAGMCAFAGPYPSILIGYGAAPILGFGLALAALRAK